MRLLPRDPTTAWTPYAWLIYMPIFVVEPLTRRTSELEWWLTAAAVAVFLPLYFTGYWVHGRRLLLVIAAIFALGAGFAPWNANAGVFVIYAAAFAGRLAPSRRGGQVLAAILALMAIESWVLHLSPYCWGPTLAMSAVIGGVNLHFVAIGRAGARLHESQAQVQQLVRIAERERIARDLHDLLGHTLSLITLKAELAGKLLAAAPERAAGEIRDVERISRDALREVRDAVAGYRSEGLAAELARARLVLEAAAVRPEYFTMPVELPPQTEAALALAVREAVTNVVRHAGAATCSITLEPRGDSVVLEVADDGHGGARERADGETGARGGGTGLRSMRERLSGLGGRLVVHSAPIAGTAPQGVQAAAAASQPGALAGIPATGTAAAPAGAAWTLSAGSPAAPRGAGGGTRVVVTVPLRAAVAAASASAASPATVREPGTAAAALPAGLAAEPGR
jgi:two-component system sensor histidine kinase DesK